MRFPSKKKFCLKIVTSTLWPAFPASPSSLKILDIPEPTIMSANYLNQSINQFLSLSLSLTLSLSLICPSVSVSLSCTNTPYWFSFFPWRTMTDTHIWALAYACACTVLKYFHKWMRQKFSFLNYLLNEMTLSIPATYFLCFITWVSTQKSQLR